MRQNAKNFKFIINRKFDDAVQDMVSIVRASRLRAAVQLSRNSMLVNSLK